MTAEDNPVQPRVEPVVFSPWLAVVGGLVLYGLTLNHWVTLRSLPMVAQVTGWDWHPLPFPWREEPMAPLFLAVTAPFRLLPAAWEPLALNLLTAVCAALTLGLLAHSVRLMPHNRTPDQRLRLTDPNGLLSIRAAFLPVLFAVLMLAGQLTFWQNAVAATGEMLNVLLFALVIYCLLRYRISRNDQWLLTSVFVYGLGDTNDWAFVGFLPLYLIVLVAIQHVRIASSQMITTKDLLAALLVKVVKNRFVWRMSLYGLAGHLLYLLIPLVGVVSGGGGFSYLFLHQFGIQRYGLMHLVPMWVVVLAGACTLLPLLFSMLWWPSYEGDINAVGNELNRFMLHSLHLAGLALALVTFFNFKYSPSARMREQPVSFLTFYYMGALCIGYFSGYVLSVLGASRVQPWERPRRVRKALDFAWTALIWVLAFGGPTLLAIQNFPRLRAGQNDALEQFSSQSLAGLPVKRAIVLSDDPGRLWLLQAACERRGIRNNNILVETASFPHREYIAYLAARYPEVKTALTTNLARLPKVLPKETLVPFMALVMQKLPQYYLHPSFSYFCEALYLRPHGVVYELKPFSTSAIQPPLESEAEIAANQAFWSKMEKGLLKTLPALAALDGDAAVASRDYSASLDYWGTELQKANRLKEAQDQFAEALRLNSNNVVASINLQYNQRLQKGDHRPIDSTDTLYEALFYYHRLALVLRYNGPPDEPGLNLKFGQMLGDGGDFGQAARLFDRRLQLLPGDPQGELEMAKIYGALRQPAKALDLVRQLRGSTNVSSWEVARCEAVADLANHDFTAAEKVLSDAIRQDPNDENRAATLADLYRSRAMDELRRHNSNEAKHYFAQALTNINLQLQVLSSPSHDTIAMFNVPDSLLKKAEMQTMLQSYDAAAATLDELLQLEPDNYVALINRAVAEVKLKQFQTAKDDYHKLRKLLAGQSYVADLGLADVAAAETNKAEEIAQLKRCVKSAPSDSGAYIIATQRLAKLQGH
jgi:tetratricopeptide (TPR) repeat protein